MKSEMSKDAVSKNNKSIFYVLLGIVGLILIIVGVVFFITSNKKNDGNLDDDKLKIIYNKYDKVNDYKYKAVGKSNGKDITIDATITSALNIGNISSKVVIDGKSLEKKYKFDVADNRYEQSMKMDGNWYTSQVSDSIDSPTNVLLVDATRLLQVLIEHMMRTDQDGKYTLNGDDSDSIVMLTQLITEGAFEHSILEGRNISLEYKFNNKDKEIKDVKICFGNCDKDHLNVTFSDIKK